MEQFVTFSNQRPFGRNGDILIFNHIPKCAGQTFTNLLNRTLPLEDCNHDSQWKGVIERVNSQNNFQGIGGHKVWGIHEHFGNHRQVFYVTFLRHPFQIVRSQYLYLYKKYDEICSFEEYILQEKGPANPLSTFLADGNPLLAFKRLEKQYYLFGFTEFFDEAIEAFSKFLPIGRKEIQVVNVTGSADEIKIRDDLTALMTKRHALDLELYDRALDLFNKRLSLLKIKRRRGTSIQEQRRIGRAKLVAFNPALMKIVKNGPVEYAYEELKKLSRQEAAYAYANIHLCRRFGDLKREEAACIEGNKLYPNFMNLELIHCLAKLKPAKGLRLIEQELAHALPMRTKTPDSRINQFISKCYFEFFLLLKQLKIKGINSEEGLALKKLVQTCEKCYEGPLPAYTAWHFMNFVNRFELRDYLLEPDSLTKRAGEVEYCPEAEAVEQFLTRLPEGVKVFLYGCGRISKILVNRKAIPEVLDCSFVTSFKDESTQFLGFPKNWVGDIVCGEMDCVLILSHVFESEMLANLTLIPRSRVYTFNEVRNSAFKLSFVFPRSGN